MKCPSTSSGSQCVSLLDSLHIVSTHFFRPLPSSSSPILAWKLPWKQWQGSYFISSVIIVVIVVISIITRYQVTIARFQPSFIRQLLHYPHIKDVDLSSLRLVLSSSSYFSSELLAKLAVVIPHKFYFGQSKYCLTSIFIAFTRLATTIFSLWDDGIGEFKFDPL